MKRLFIDIPKLLASNGDPKNIECEYAYHRKNDGALSLLEVAEFISYCRQCKEAFCIDACPKEALERLDSGVVKRWNMRCVGCKSCALACPFGSFQMAEIEEQPDQHIFYAGDHLAVKSPSWLQKEGKR